MQDMMKTTIHRPNKSSHRPSLLLCDIHTQNFSWILKGAWSVLGAQAVEVCRFISRAFLLDWPTINLKKKISRNK